LAIQGKRSAKNPVSYLTRAEMDALLAAPDQTIWSGLRDRTLLLLALETGFRVSELIGLRWQDVVFGTGAHVKCMGKGRNYAKVVVMQRCHAVGTNLHPTATGICGASESTNALRLRPDLGLAMPE
jgi:site-specific recombinase XerD